MKKVACFLIFCCLIAVFIFYQARFNIKKSYVMDEGIPYFKNENDVLKVYDLKNKLDEEEDVALDATIYEAINQDSKR